MQIGQAMKNTANISHPVTSCYRRVYAIGMRIEWGKTANDCVSSYNNLVETATGCIEKSAENAAFMRASRMFNGQRVAQTLASLPPL